MVSLVMWSIFAEVGDWLVGFERAVICQTLFLVRDKMSFKSEKWSILLEPAQKIIVISVEIYKRYKLS